MQPKDKETDKWERRIKSLKEEKKQLQQKIADLSYRCNMQSKILDTGNLSTLQVLLDHLIVDVNGQLKKILTELLYAEFDPQDTIALYKFREFLLAVHSQIGTFLALPEGLVHMEMQRIQNKQAEIGAALEHLNGMSQEVMVEVLEAQERLHEHILQILEEK